VQRCHQRIYCNIRPISPLLGQFLVGYACSAWHSTINEDKRNRLKVIKKRALAATHDKDSSYEVHCALYVYGIESVIFRLDLMTLYFLKQSLSIYRLSASVVVCIGCCRLNTIRKSSRSFAVQKNCQASVRLFAEQNDFATFLYFNALMAINNRNSLEKV
jgi:hypothetical protein